MPKKKELVTVLNNGRFHYKCSPARVRKMLQKKEVKVISIDPFIVSKVKYNKSNLRDKKFKLKE